MRVIRSMFYKTPREKIKNELISSKLRGRLSPVGHAILKGGAQRARQTGSTQACPELEELWPRGLPAEPRFKKSNWLLHSSSGSAWPLGYSVTPGAAAPQENTDQRGDTRAWSGWQLSSSLSINKPRHVWALACHAPAHRERKFRSLTTFVWSPAWVSSSINTSITESTGWGLYHYGTGSKVTKEWRRGDEEG